MDEQILVGDGALTQLRGFGGRRLRVILELARHPELDDPTWLGQAVFSFGNGLGIKGAIQPALRDLAA